MEQLLSNLKKSAVQIYANVKDMYWSMTFGNRVVAALLMAMLLLSLGYLIVGSIRPAELGSKTVKLYNGHRFDQNDQRAAEDALANKGLRGHQWVGDQLLVPTDKQHLYTATLAEASVISPTGSARYDTAKNLTAWDAFRTMSERMRTATEQDCAAAVKKITGIADADVVSNQRRAWETKVWDKMTITSVGVFIEAIENKPLSADTIGAIGQIVKASFGITNMNEISIVDRKHSRAYNGSGEQQGSSQSAYLRHQMRYEEEFSSRIYGHLPYIAGLSVETSVKLTQYRDRQTFEVIHDKPTPLVTHVKGSDFLHEGYGYFFRPGYIAQFSNPLIDPMGHQGPSAKTTEKKHEAEDTYALPGTEAKEEALPFIPIQMTASIRIPRDYVLAQWHEKNQIFGDGDPDAKPTREELEAEEEIITLDTKRSIAKLIETHKLSSKVDPMECVEVIYYHRSLPKEIELTTWEQVVLFLKQHWQSLSLMSLVFSGLVVLWIISKPQKPDNIVIYEGLETPIDAIDARIAEKIRREEEEAARLAAEEAAARAEQEEFENSLGELGSLRSLKDEIAELIAKNPEAAAAVIRQWIGNAVLVEAKS